MAERTGKRELTYSAWHRPASIKRWLSTRDAARLGMVDIDAVEYEADNEYRPIALIETAHDIHQAFKPAHVTVKLAELAGLPAYVVLFTPSTSPNPYARFGELDIDRLRVAPADDQSRWETMTPNEYAHWLLELRGAMRNG